MIFKFLLHVFAVTNVALLAICAYTYSDCQYPAASFPIEAASHYTPSHDFTGSISIRSTQSLQASDRDMP